MNPQYYTTAVLVLVTLFVVVVVLPDTGCYGKIYETDTRKVDFTIETENVTESTDTVTTACVELLEGFEEDFTTACFSQLINERGVFKECELTLDGEACTDCVVCRTTDDSVGYTLDCYNLQPTKNVGVCKQFLNSTIQEILVEDYYSNVPFDFGANATSTDGDSTDEESSGTRIAFGTSTMNGAVSILLLLLPVVPLVHMFPSAYF